MHKQNYIIYHNIDLNNNELYNYDFKEEHP